MADWDDIPDAGSEQPTSDAWGNIPDADQALDGIYRQARTQTVGDQFAQTMLLADRTKWPSPLVEKQQTEAGIIAERPDFKALTKEAPHLAWAMTNRDFMRLAYDDGPELSVVEKTLRSFGYGGASAAGLGIQGQGTYIESILAPFNKQGAKLGKALYELFPSQNAAILPEVSDTIRTALDPGKALPASADLMGGAIRDLGEAMAVPEDQKEWYTDLAEAVGQLGFQAAMSYISPGAAGAMFTGLGYQIGYERALEKTGDEQTAQAVGTLSAAVEGITEKLGIDGLMRVVPPAVRQGTFRFIADVATSFGIETSQELLANWGQNALDKYFLGEEGQPIFSFPGSEELSAGGAAAILRTLVIGLSRGRASMTAEEQAEARRQYFADVQTAVTGSKLFTRHKDTFTTYAQSVLQESDHATAYIDGRGVSVYLESLPEEQRAELIEQLGGAQKVREAADFGQDITMPLSEFLKFADTEHYDALTADTRLRASDLTVRELEAAKTRLDAQAEAILAEQKEESTMASDADAVALEVERQLVEAGQIPAVAKTNAALHRANAIVLAHELGITPTQVYQKFGLNITSEFTPGREGGQAFDQDYVLPTGAQFAGYRPQRIDRLLEEYGYSSGRAVAAVVSIDPASFLGATTVSQQARDMVSAETEELDPERLAAETQTPFINVTRKENGELEITGHEGRHRMLALARAGVTSVPVVVRGDWTGYNDTSLGLSAEVGQIRGQGGAAQPLFYNRAVDITYENKDKLTQTHAAGDTLFQEITYGQEAEGGDAGAVPVAGQAEQRAGGEGRVPPATDRPYRGREADGSLQGLPRQVGGFEASAWKPAQKVARKYMEDAGLPYYPPVSYAKVDKARAARIAEAFEAMEHNPHDPLVKMAYAALVEETKAQYQAVLDSGLVVEFIEGEDPYAESPRAMTEDVRNNNHMWVFSTREGFGSSEFDPADNPLLEETEFEISGQPALVNDLFRVVHDYFGHVKEGVGFRADGEENAWRAHSAMFSPLAQRALTTETRGQNSWVNFGPYGDVNRTATAEETHYADQKIGLLPIWVSEEGRNDREVPTSLHEAGFVRSDGRVPLTHYGVQGGLTQLDPAAYGTGTRGTERARVTLPRTYFYLPGATVEPAVRGHAKHRYFTTVGPKEIYDLRADPMGLREVARAREAEKEVYQRYPGLQVSVTPDMLENEIKEAGYKGYWVDTPFPAVAMFEPTDVMEVTNVKPEDPARAGWDEAGAQQDRGDGMTLFQSAAEEAQRNAIGLYSQVEKTIINMNIPGWKASKKDIAEGREPAATGQDIWAKVSKEAGVKQEELFWLGLEQFLGLKDRFTREEVLEYVRDNGVRVEETVGDTPVDTDAETGLEWEEEIDDSDSAWDWRAGDLIDLWGDSPSDYDWVFDLEYWMEQNSKVVVDFYRSSLEGEELADFEASEDRMGWLEEAGLLDPDDFKDLPEVQAQVEEAARSAAQREYFENPMYIYTATYNGETLHSSTGQQLAITGSDDSGWWLTGIGPGKDFASLEDAQQDAYDLALEEGIILSPESESAAFWWTMVADGFSENYREIKLTLPGVEGYFMEEAHQFTEENIVAFMRVTDRDLVAQKQELPKELRDPDDVDFNDPEIPGDMYVTGQNKTFSELMFILPEQRISQALKSYAEWSPEQREAAYRQGYAAQVKKLTLEARENVAKAFYIEELQSDWHQQGSSYGYQLSPAKSEELRQQIAEGKARLEKLQEDLYQEILAAKDARFEYVPPEDVVNGRGHHSLVDTETGKSVSTYGFAAHDTDRKAAIVSMEERLAALVASEHPEVQRLERQISGAERRVFSRIPDAPFKDNAWQELALKRAIIRAAEDGYSILAWSDANTVAKMEGTNKPDMYVNEYDKKLPSRAAKLLTKIAGQKVRVNHLYGEQGGYWAVELTPEMRGKIREEGFTLFQKGAKKKERGQIFFPGNFPQAAAEIQLTENADLSTFLHETGHFFLQTRIELVKSGEATDSIRKDMEVLLDWFGVDSVEKIGVEHHEQFARGFEMYLREGNAPSPELQTVFARFRAWLLEVYKNVMDLRVQLTPEVREVMDRLLATQEALEANEVYKQIDSLFPSQEESGLTRVEYDEYLQALDDARHYAIEDLDRIQLQELKREVNDEYLQTKEKVTAEVQAELAEEPVYQAKEFLMHGRLPNQEGLPQGLSPMKLSPNAIKEIYGDIPRGLPQGKYSPLAKDGEGVHPDVVAELFGFESGSSMLDEMMRRPSYTQAVKDRVDMRMEAEHGDLRFDPVKIADAASELAANRKQERVLLIELRALEKQANLQPTVKQALRLAAKRRVASLLVKGVRPNDYLQAMLRAGKEATRLAAEKDFEGAAKAKRQQVFNELMWREARRTKEEMEKGRRYLRKFERPGTRKNLARDYLDQIDTIMEAVRIKPISQAELEKRARLTDWIKSQEEQGLEVVFDADFIQELSRKPFDSYTVEEMRGLLDAIKNIEHLGRLKQRLLVNQQRRDFNETVEEMVAEAHNNVKVSPVPVEQPRGKWGKVKRFTEQFWAHHLKVEFMLEELDGNKDGIWQAAVFQPLADAESAEADMLNAANEQLNAIWEGVDTKTRRAWNTQAKNIPELGRSFTKNELYAMALNMGNDGNVDALTRGEGWSRDQVLTILNRELNAEDWKRVQAIWDYIDSFWPQIAELQKELTGVVPEKVPARALATSGGMLRGGYYPLSYDPERSSRTLKNQEAQNVKELYGGNALRPSTRKGHTKERVGSGGQKVLLSLGVLNNHVTNVIHDLTHRVAVLQADRLLQDERIAEVIRGTAGREAYKMMRPWLTTIANQTRLIQDPFEQAVGVVRKNATIVNMGYKLTTAIVQPLGYLQSVELLGAKQAMKGLSLFYGSPSKVKQNVEWIFEKSAMMRNRSKSFDRDVKDAIKRIEGDGLKANFDRTYLAHIGFFDLMVSMPTWMAGYDKALAEGKTEKQAVDYADKMVRMSQSAGNAKDLAAIQGGSEYKRMFTMFYSYFNVLHNLLRRRGKIASRGGMSAGNIAKTTMSMLYLVILPAVLSEIIVGRWPDEDDDDPYVKMAWLIAGYPFATVVGVRDLANAAITGYGYSLTPLADAGAALLRGGEGPFDGEVSETDLKYLTMSAGYIFGLPARQLWITGSNLYDLAEGKKLNWAELLMLQEHRED